MADTVPGADELPSVQPRPLPMPFDENRVGPEAYGAGAGDALERTGALTGAIAAEARERANLAAVMSARGAADNAINSQILDDQGGFRSLRGHDAMAQSDKYVQKYQQTLQQISDGLATDEQKRAFSPYMLSAQQEAFRHVQAHTWHQTQVVEADSYKGAIDALRNKLGALPVAISSDERQKTLDSIDKTARARAYAVFGRSASKEEIGNYTVPARAEAVRQMLDTLLANDAAPGALDEAKKIIADPQSQLLLGGAHTALVQGRINRRSNEQLGLRTAQAVATFNLVNGTTIVSERADEDLRAAQDKMSPEAFKIADDRLQSLKVHGRQMQKQRNEAAFTRGVTAIGKGDTGGFQRAVDELSASQGEAEGGQLLKSLYEFRSSTARKDATSPEVIRAQAYAFNQATSMLGSMRASDTTLDAFMATSMPDGRPLAQSLSPADQKKIGEAFQKKAEKEAADKPLRSDAVKQIIEAMGEAGLYPKTMGLAPTDDQIKRRNWVQDYVRQQRNAWQEENPKNEPSRTEYAGWINEMVGKVPGSNPHWWSGDLSRVDLELERQATPAPQTTAATPVAPPARPQPKAAPKAISSYRYNKTRTQRIPVYSDGSEGAPEANQ